MLMALQATRANARWLHLLLLALPALAGCTNSPLWRFDHYDVRGELKGKTCQVSIDGTPVNARGPEASDSVLVLLDYAFNIGLPAGQGLKSASCQGVLLSFSAPTGTLPSRGEYQIVSSDSYPQRTATAAYSGPKVNAGLWPLATGVSLDGYQGVIQLDSMDRSGVWARFHFVGRRQHSGE